MLSFKHCKRAHGHHMYTYNVTHMFASIRYIQVLRAYTYENIPTDGTENEPTLSFILLRSHVSYNKRFHVMKAFLR